MTELTQTKYRFGILIRFTHNIPYQTGFENSTGNTMYSIKDETLVSTRSLENKKIITRCWTRSQENSHRDSRLEIWDHQSHMIV